MSVKTKWVLDPSHSEVGFKVKHMMFTNVSGKFSDFNVDVETEADDFTKSAIRFEADMASVSTGNNDRDNHLRGEDFFDVTQFPKMSFAAGSLRQKDGDDYELAGDLTMHGITRPVSLDVEYGGLGKDPWGNIKAGFSISGKINRKDWGLAYNAVLDNGGLLLGEDIKLHIEIQLVKQQN